MNAKVIIKDVDSPKITIASFIDDAGRGWTRKVHKFRIAGTGERRVNIYLTADASQDKYVYFDL
jgi:hypothetical protein